VGVPRLLGFHRGRGQSTLVDKHDAMPAMEAFIGGGSGSSPVVVACRHAAAPFTQPAAHDKSEFLKCPLFTDYMNQALSLLNAFPSLFFPCP
jgi:hypothetical protein